LPVGQTDGSVQILLSIRHDGEDGILGDFCGNDASLALTTKSGCRSDEILLKPKINRLAVVITTNNVFNSTPQRLIKE
jgi:hypothetical protein